MADDRRMGEHRLPRSGRVAWLVFGCALGLACADDEVTDGGRDAGGGGSGGRPTGGGGSGGVADGGSGGGVGGTGGGVGGSGGGAGGANVGGAGGANVGGAGGGDGGAGGAACEPSLEVCNGEDDDCNDVVDDPTAVDGLPCVTGGLGACSEGVTQCVDGESTCLEVLQPGDEDEVCDLIDNDCDGVPDDGDPESGAACEAAADGACAEGTMHCIAGELDCVPADPTTESCNDIDDDCDGEVDNGNPGGGDSCVSGLPGVCSAGVTVCDGENGVVCLPLIAPGTLSEQCNNLDDDCNGEADDAVPDVGTDCSVPGGQGICEPGTLVCADGDLVCEGIEPGTFAETCNMLDDDCNGTIDDPLVLNGQPCLTAFPGACSPGTTLCSGGAVQCIPNVQPNQQAEQCNLADDNCNGQIDEMNPNPTCTSQNPNAVFVQSWACNTGACDIVACTSGHADINNADGDGCECVTDAHANQCSAASAVSVPIGGTTTMTGKIESAAGSDYLTFNFTVPSVGQAYHPRLELTNNAGGQYAMDVLVSCPGTAAGCSTFGGANNENGIQVSVWEQNYNGYTPGAGCCADNTPRVGQVRVRVYRRFANQPTCDSYTVAATNP